MPGFDRSGPQGEGPRTGRGFGLCGPWAADAEAGFRAFDRRPWGGGRGMQRGFRRGFCFFSRGGYAGGFRPNRAAGAGFADTAAAEMRAQAAELRRRLAAIEERLAGLGAKEERDPEGGES